MKKYIVGIIIGIFITLSFDVIADSLFVGENVSYNDTNIQNAIDDLYDKANFGNASPGSVLTGNNVLIKEEKISGTMPNYGAVNPTALNAGGSYTIPAGYHNGFGKVTAASLSSQTSGTATAADIVSGKIAWVNGMKITGNSTTGIPTIVDIRVGGSWTAPKDYAVLYAFTVRGITDPPGISGSIIRTQLFQINSNTTSSGYFSGYKLENVKKGDVLTFGWETFLFTV